MSEKLAWESAKTKIPEATVNRLSTYARILDRASGEGAELIASADLARRCGFKPAQIRKDLAYFGEFGVRGKGYYIKELRYNLKKILGVTRTWKVVLVGAGNLGSALLAYKGFLAHGFEIAAVFDKFPERIPARRTGRLPALPMSSLREVVREKDIKIGVIAVPGGSAQNVGTALVQAGITGILNFAPTQIQTPRHVKVKNVDLGSELEHLSFHLSQNA